MLNTTGWTVHGALTGSRLHRRTAATAEAVLADPSADLRGVAKQAKQVRVNLLHELTQPLPARYIGGDIQFEKKDRFAIEMPQPLLAEQRQLDA